MIYSIISLHPSVGSEVEFGTGLFVFDEGRTVTCKTITAIDDNVSDGTRTSRLIIGIESGTSVPVEIHPDSIPITIRDNDGEYTHTEIGTQN